MKIFIKILLLAILFMSVGCKSKTLNISQENLAYVTFITMEVGINEKYFSSAYNVYKPKNIEKTNNELNEYLVEWHVNQAAWEELALKLNVDDNVKTIRLSYD